MVLILTVVFTVTALYNHYAFRYSKQAIILLDKVSVRSGLAEDSTELFLLHAGTKVKIDKENKDFYRIYFSDGKIGWLKKSEVGVI
ncbi:MAG: SH3 domain-containing protein [Pseudomonadota bacterium]|uniref:SH3 domain-containing protein n=1 Tax=Candidatus Desulfatibia profunda TaxID=2841695 RepID=A0A8J6NWX7_9BACT|nr:SH3 domain-containing protein [Candidatus Desulfatibia profunda]MBL7181351.1 SH3 domain-containing protein [Desulfobacterales bacterium]